MLEYKAIRSPATSTPIYIEGCESRGSIFNPPKPVQSSNLRESTANIQDGKEAEAHGLELAKEWVDER